jgi:hypothetical protein
MGSGPKNVPPFDGECLRGANAVRTGESAESIQVRVVERKRLPHALRLARALAHPAEMGRMPSDRPLLSDACPRGSMI